MTEYNYASFPLTMSDEDFTRFPGLMKAGQPVSESAASSGGGDT